MARGAVLRWGSGAELGVCGQGLIVRLSKNDKVNPAREPFGLEAVQQLPYRVSLGLRVPRLVARRRPFGLPAN